MFRSVTRSFLIIHMILYIYDFRRSLFASWTREEYKIRWFDISKRVRSHGIGIIASLQLRNLMMNHIASLLRDRYMGVVDTYFRLIDPHPLPLGRGGGKNWRRNRYAYETRLVSETLQTAFPLRPILRLVASLSRGRALLLREDGRDFGEIRVIAMTQNSRSSARKSLDSVPGITNTVYTATVTMSRENQACAEEGEHGRWQ